MKKLLVILALGCCLLVDHVQSGIPFNIQVCTSKGNCTTETAGQVIQYPYTGCVDQRNCDYIPPLSDYYNWGVSFTDNEITLKYVTPYNTNGAGTFLTAGPNADTYRMFKMLGQEISFETDMSTVPCGLNAALFFVAAPEDGGKEKYGFSGAAYGTGYCDGQPAQPDRPTCDEFDMVEANSLAGSMGAIHPCDANGNNCQTVGCLANPYPMGHPNFYGRGPSYEVDTTQPFTVVIRYPTDENGNLKAIEKSFVQNGKTIEFPYVGPYNSLSDEYCTAYGMQNPTRDIISGMTKSFADGMMLTFAFWGSMTDPNSMFWLDQPPNGPCPVYTNSDPYVSFGNIKVGPIGSTV